MDGYKVFNKDWTTNHGDIVFEVGMTYRTAGSPELCWSGLHFCKDMSDCFEYYDADCGVHVCRVRAVGEVVEGDGKCCTNALEIIQEISWSEICEAMGWKPDNLGERNGGHWNIGNENSGSYNAGSHNAGDHNAGGWNQGYRNSGTSNAGSHNAGSHNAGDRNRGDWNRGSHNSGCFNAGSHNAGDWNVGDRNMGDWNYSSGNHGCFCTEKGGGTINMFDAPSPWTIQDWIDSKARALLKELEKSYHSYGHLFAENGKWSSYAQGWWDSLPAKDQAEILALPNFDRDKFFYCTGICAEED